MTAIFLFGGAESIRDEKSMARENDPEIPPKLRYYFLGPRPLDPHPPSYEAGDLIS